jgi:hypothetical protein
MELAYAALHQLCAPMLDHLERLPLTSQESPVARLAAEGLTNPRHWRPTVHQREDRPVPPESKVFTKLGISSRANLVMPLAIVASRTASVLSTEKRAYRHAAAIGGTI